MKLLMFFLASAFCIVIYTNSIYAQALEPVGGPYVADSNTVLLLHFDGSLTNSAATLGKTATSAVPHSTNIAGKISYIDMPSPLTALGKAIHLDNSSINDSTYLTVPDTVALDMTGSWTIESWVNIFTFGTGSNDYRWVPRVIMKPGDDVFWHPNYWLEMWGDNRLFHAGYYTPNDAFISVTSPNNMFVPGEWVHLTFIRDTARGFIAVMVHDANRKLKAFLSAGFDKTKDIPKTNSQDLHIGWAGSRKIAAPSTDSWLDGFIDEIRISNDVRNFQGPPVIKKVTLLANQPSTLTSYPVEVNVIPLNAGGSISNVTLYYRTDTNAAFTSITLASAGNDIYSGSIPAQTSGKLIQYYYKVSDNNSQISLSPYDAETNNNYYSFFIYQPNSKTLDLTFEEGPNGSPIDHSTNNCIINTFKDFSYSTDAPMGGGNYSLDVKARADGQIDSSWVTASSPFLASEEFTLDCWVKPDSADRPYVHLIINPSSEEDWNNANFDLSFRPNANGDNAFTARYWKIDGTGSVVIQDTLPAVTAHVGHWRHVILEREKATGNFSMTIKDENDHLMFTKTVTEMVGPLMAGAPLKIGRSWFLLSDPYYVGPYRGLIDNVQVYNYAVPGITGVSDKNSQTPDKFTLSQNYPNPFNPSTVIEYTLPKFQHVSIIVYNVLGQQVRTLVDDVQHAGQHRIIWNSTNNLGSSVTSGVYFYQIKSGDKSIVRKMMLLR